VESRYTSYTVTGMSQVFRIVSKKDQTGEVTGDCKHVNGVCGFLKGAMA
jgi:hypothetical protein